MTRTKTTHPVTTPDTPIRRLHYLHAQCFQSFRAIAALGEFSPCPAGTLCAIFNGAEVPEKWRELFKLPALIPTAPCAKCGIVHVSKRCTANSVRKSARWVRVLGHAAGEWQ